MPIDFLAKRPSVVADTECFPNAWMIGFKARETGKIVKIAKYKHIELDRSRIATIMRHHRVFTFNGLHYDIPMILLAMQGASVEELKIANDLIIPGGGMEGMKAWEFFDHYGLKVPEWLDHIDLFRVGPSAAQKASLKKYAGMMHSKTMMEFNHHFNTPLDDDSFPLAFKYLDNDLHVTHDMADELTPQIEIRNHISAKLGVDVRSKSDAQIGEEKIRHEVTKRKFGSNPNRKRLYRPDIVPGPFKYIAPEYIKFETPMMQNVLSRLLREDFIVRRDGYVQLPELFAKKKKKQQKGDDEIDFDDEEEGGSEIIIGGSTYKMGIGGLHSQEANISWFEDEEYILVDRDVTSYYPNMILRSGQEPDNMRGHFRPVYQGMVDERILAKAEGRKNDAESGKVQVNGPFGKTGSPWSIIYAPKMMIQTTVTGQLALFMAIEGANLRGWKVISANTDGFVTRVPRKEYGLFTAYMFDWEQQTGLITEEVRYRSIHSISVNSYFAIKYKTDKKGNLLDEFEVKRKSAFAHSGRGQPAAIGLKKVPMDEICYDAVVEHMLNGTSIESTIRECQDIRKFVTVRQVTGGACTADGEIVGKVVRYYFAEGNTEPLRYVKSGNRVPSSAGAEPCMTLPDELPRDIDYAYYEREAYNIMHDCGLNAKDPTTYGKSGTFFGVLEEQKTVHVVDAGTAVAVCGAARKHRRQNWNPVEKTMNMRFCSKCKKADSL